MLKRPNTRCHAKFGQNQSNRGRDMVTFRFSKMVAATAFDF